MADIEMVIDSIRVSLMNYQRVVILKEKEGERFLPCWIGPAEADAIRIKLQSVAVPRPLTHDLLCNITNIAGLKIKSAIINELKKDTFYAKLVLITHDKSYEVDCRPSDALAIAVRMGAPIFADEKVLKKAGVCLDEETSKPVQPYEPESDRLKIFSESAKDVMSLAEKEAKRLNHNFVSTGHLLLALIKSVSTVAYQVLSNLGVDLSKIPVELEASINQSNFESGGTGLSSALKSAIELSIRETRLLGSGSVQPEHLLLGLVRQGDGIAGNLLKDKEINAEKIYAALIRLNTGAQY